ncbi:MAG: type II secretion system protein [Phycisphaeraceae bacterium]|nr:type II secretion system protein [Phycisphaeraceae bacterium]
MNHTTAQRAFTLIELLVVIGLTAMLLLIAVPSITNLIDSAKGATAVNSVSAAVASARAKAPFSGPFQTGEYVGTAIIFSPSWEMRIVRHTDGTTLKNGSSGALDPERAAYKDSGSYIRLPEGIGALGIARGGSSDTVYYIPPPFAIRFNPKGMLMGNTANLSANPPVGLVHYDGDFNDLYVYSRDRNGVNYDPEAFDPESKDYDPTNRIDVTIGGNQETRVQVPLEVIEACVGLILYNKQDFWAAFADGLPNDGARIDATSAEGQWLTQNGDVLYFNRYTGAVLDQ